MHGQINEKKALNKFEEHYLKSNLKVEQCGLFIMKNHPHLKASPDGLIGDQTVVEVKCLYSAQDLAPNEINIDCSYRN